MTSEVYTLGTVPFTATPAFIKTGFDLMATSGVNNFFYHGLSATYFGSEELTSDDNYLTEEGWRAWPTIGGEMAATNPMSSYYGSMNAYAARANYVMQSGTQSSDIAVYMPLFGEMSVSSGGFMAPSDPTEAVRTLNTNGYIWDAINDDAIQNDLTWDGEQLVMPNGASYAALIVERQTLPVQTMQQLSALADQGAPILFLGELPTRQPSYADGDYAALDAEVSQIALDMTAGKAIHTADNAALVEALLSIDVPMITYDANESIRMNRRTYETGSELAYIRNTSAEAETQLVIRVYESLVYSYWLDQNTGKIYAAENNGGEIAVTLPAGGAIILLCEPESVAMDAASLASGMPLSISQIDEADVLTIDAFTLEVTADNIGSYIPGEVQTVTYDVDALGDWSQDTFQDGALKYVSDAGPYVATFNYEGGDVGQMVLDLGQIGAAATVRLNGETIGQAFYAPYELDVTDALVVGQNTLEIDV